MLIDCKIKFKKKSETIYILYIYMYTLFSFKKNEPLILGFKVLSAQYFMIIYVPC